jgi:hypothetical protein
VKEQIKGTSKGMAEQCQRLNFAVSCKHQRDPLVKGAFYQSHGHTGDYHSCLRDLIVAEEKWSRCYLDLEG